jgi:hydroxymethylpyrimidine pyrophosphatase-like HAD family hydrolase
VLRYVAEQFPVPVPAEGPLCAVDLDGVLEGGTFGFSVVTPTAAAALRALACHGFRPVPVTGRCLDEVRERCESFGLPGGVAEYGAVAYDHATGRVEQLVTPEDLELLDRLRALLRAAPDVRVDDDHRFSVRVSRPDRPGPAPAPSLESALTALGADRARLRVIPGRGQTDVIAAATDKGTGLQALASLLGGATAADVHLAVGDAAPDLPMLALARHAYAPGQADAAVRAAGVRALRQPYAAGFSAAVRQVIGHRPGHWARCRQEPPNPRARVLLAILDAQRAGRAGLPGASYRAAVATLRFRR